MINRHAFSLLPSCMASNRGFEFYENFDDGGPLPAAQNKKKRTKRKRNEVCVRVERCVSVCVYAKGD